MQSSILLAKIIGPLFVLVGLGFFLNRDHYKKMIASFLENSEMYYFSGTIAFIIGVVMVEYHNLWVSDWRIVVTIIGWMSLIKGIGRIVFPAAGRAVAGVLLRRGDAALLFGSGLLLLVGLFLGYQAFTA